MLLKDLLDKQNKELKRSDVSFKYGRLNIISDYINKKTDAYLRIKNREVIIEIGEYKIVFDIKCMLVLREYRKKLIISEVLLNKDENQSLLNIEVKDIIKELKDKDRKLEQQKKNEYNNKLGEFKCFLAEKNMTYEEFKNMVYIERSLHYEDTEKLK